MKSRLKIAQIVVKTLIVSKTMLQKNQSVFVNKDTQEMVLFVKVHMLVITMLINVINLQIV
jgi:hypothetical protein